MDERYFFSPCEVNISSVRSYTEKLSFAEEQRLCEISEIASSAARFAGQMLNDGMSWYDILCFLSDSLGFGVKDIRFDTLEDNLPRMGRFAELAGTFDEAVFCTLFFEYLKNHGVSLSEKDFFAYPPNDETFVYVKNAFADEAYDVFSQDFSDPRLKYAPSFKEAVKLVCANIVSYCLLPIEERG